MNLENSETIRQKGNRTKKKTCENTANKHIIEKLLPWCNKEDKQETKEVLLLFQHSSI